MSERESIRAIAERVSNWGRWGEADEAGTLNHITPASVLAGAGAVKHGVTVSLELPIRNNWGPQTNQARTGRVNPVHLMSVVGAIGDDPDIFGRDLRYSDDYIIMAGQAGSQWDALSHLWYEDELYNGFPAEVVSSRGAARCDIGGVSERFVARGVLLDVARSKGVDELDQGYAITIDDLFAAEEFGGVRAQTGDIVIVRTGLLGAAVRENQWERFGRPQPGLHFSTAEWIAEREIAAIAADNTMLEASGVLSEYVIPLHILLLRDMGVHIGEYWLLEELSAACAEHAKYDMLLAAQPLRISGGVGSPVNPIAIL